MPRKIERIFRDRKLTPEEAAADEEIRRHVEQEFPPARDNEDARDSEQD